MNILKVIKYPWLVPLWERYAGPDPNTPEYSKQGSKNPRCGGTIIASRFVITAAHCLFMENPDTKVVIGRRMPNQIAIRIGDYNLDSWISAGDTGLEKFVNVKEIHVHDYYPLKDNWVGQSLNNPLLYNFDVAILELEEDINLNVYRPACLPKDSDGRTFDGKDLTFAGWGLIPAPYTFQKPYLPNKPYEVVLNGIENCEQHPLPWLFCASFFEDRSRSPCRVSSVETAFIADRMSLKVPLGNIAM